MTNETTHDTMVAQTEKAGVLLDYFQGHRDALEADRVGHGAAVAAQLGNLKAVVTQQLNYTATWNPQEPNPTNVRGGVFADLQLLLNDAGSGAYIGITMVPGQVYDFGGNAEVHENCTVYFSGNAANSPTINVLSYHTVGSTGYNHLYTLQMALGSRVFFQDVDVNLEGKKVAGDPWSAGSGFVFGQRHGGPAITVGMSGCSWTGADGNSVTFAHVANVITLGAFNCTFDGAMSLSGTVTGRGVALLALYAVTFTNGATAEGAATLGTNLLKG